MRLAIAAYSDSAFESSPGGVPGCCDSVLRDSPAFVDAKLFAVVPLAFDYYLL